MPAAISDEREIRSPDVHALQGERMGRFQARRWTPNGEQDALAGSWSSVVGVTLQETRGRLFTQGAAGPHTERTAVTGFTVAGSSRLEGTISYLIGSDPASWLVEPVTYELGLAFGGTVARAPWIEVAVFECRVKEEPAAGFVLRAFFPENGYRFTTVVPDADEGPLARLRILISQNRIHEARGLVARLRARGDRSPELDRWSAALEPPKVRRDSSTSLADWSADRKWLRQHASEYRGRWVALRDGALLDSDESRSRLRDRLSRSSGLRGVLLTRVPPPRPE